MQRQSVQQTTIGHKVIGKRWAGALEWARSRFVLYVLVQIPMLAFVTGYLWGWSTFSTTTIVGLYAAFILTPLWVVREKQRSQNPADPVHHLARYSLWALVPFAIYDLARVPTYYLLDAPYWDRWYDFGARITNGPLEEWSSLVAGTLVHSIQGWVLGLGYFILFRRHTLAGAVAYLGIFLSFVYAWLFVSFASSEPTAEFLFVVFWAHLWMAVAAWAVAKLHSRQWVAGRGRTAATAATAATATACGSPFALAFWEAAAAV
ncbi:MAG: hypothetical protein M3454_16700 [Actinomycetota bacterium]|nr:hypothetical protein [Actinomycetota bacterium]